MRTMLRLLLVLLLFSPFVFSQGRVVKGRSEGVYLGRPQMNAPATVPNKVTGTPLPAGSYTIGVGGYFPTIDSAYRRLEADGIGGPVRLLLTDTLYVAPFPPGDFRLIGPIAGAGPASRITIRPADNVAARLEGSGYATLTFEDVSYLTLDGISLEGSTRLKVHTSVNTFYDWNDAIDLWGDCNNDIVQNLTAGSDRIHPWTTTILLISKDATTVDSCVVSGVSITSGGNGIGVGGYNSLNRPNGNVIRENHIGSPTDSLISRGIQVEAANGTIVENNHVEHLARKLTSGNLTSVIGINSYYCSNTIIRNNVVHGLRGDAGGSMYGILASGEQMKVGQGVQTYNNMVYDLQNKSTTTTGYIGGIILWYNSNALIANNSVWLNGTSADPAGSDALGLIEAISNATIRNNILVNTYHVTGTGGSTALWVAQGMSFTSDHNDLVVDTTFANNNVVHQWTVGGVRTLSQWQGAGYDAHSVSASPVFRGPYVHIDTTRAANQALSNKGTPLGQVLTDIDGQPRDPVNPDIGADEFVNIVTGVVTDKRELPAAFSLEQNFPNPFNPTTVVSFRVPIATQVKLTVYDLLGREVATLVNEVREPGMYSVEFDGSKLSSGVYVYRFAAGSHVECRKMVLMK